MAHARDDPHRSDLPAMKTCTTCWTRRWLDEFSPHPRTQDGRQSRCKTCCAAVLAEYRRTHSEVVRATKARSYRRLRGARLG